MEKNDNEEDHFNKITPLGQPMKLGGYEPEELKSKIEEFKKQYNRDWCTKAEIMRWLEWSGKRWDNYRSWVVADINVISEKESIKRKTIPDSVADHLATTKRTEMLKAAKSKLVRDPDFQYAKSQNELPLGRDHEATCWQIEIYEKRKAKAGDKVMTWNEVLKVREKIAKAFKGLPKEKTGNIAVGSEASMSLTGIYTWAEHDEKAYQKMLKEWKEEEEAKKQASKRLKYFSDEIAKIDQKIAELEKENAD